jgi:WD40 repeat protein
MYVLFGLVHLLCPLFTEPHLQVRAVLPLSNDVVISAARDKTVRSWNRNKSNDFQEDRLYSGHTNYVNALAYLPPNEDHPNGKCQDDRVKHFVLCASANTCSNSHRSHCFLWSWKSHPRSRR